MEPEFTLKTYVMNEKGFAEMQEYKKVMADAIRASRKLMNASRNKSLFETKVEEAIFWGAKAIAGKEGNYTEIKEA